ncbi:hypothetical protein ACIOEZ_27830 [Streptomyces sp. NPDC087866]|uniref:Uncharacterized protein n=1 Tax=Streptomyces drozdowiczii TaxID=202862 RepID=A0ABY6PTJ8_9ACTN|nr:MULTISPECIES: hypothetical protein [Streptomyces]MCX0244643.1 hypothetical protein [Streptomyces drozdowiczii]MCX4448346.1 hypothetical protein [Streptomyces sp. NBC_01789]NEC67936.1 hypothetical protein [Streptomyces sp. SID9727]NED12765.1 hypothetical protein [Streptomyces sp. SID9124]TXS05430.1 hypothetical protein EAO73_04725 [Streptomyces sp. col6]
MGWTHDFGDAARNRRSTATAVPGIHEGDGLQGRVHALHVMHDPRLGISRILRRRARWVSARLRHPRN